MPSGKAALAEKEFYRQFRKRVSEPFIKRLGLTKDKVKDNDEATLLLRAIEDGDLETIVYSNLIAQEGKVGKSGISKFLDAAGNLAQWAEGYGIKRLGPLLITILQTSFKILYQKYLEEYADKYHFENQLEKAVGFVLSSGGDDDDLKTLPATPTTKPTT